MTFGIHSVIVVHVSFQVKLFPLVVFYGTTKDAIVRVNATSGTKTGSGFGMWRAVVLTRDCAPLVERVCVICPRLAKETFSSSTLTAALQKIIVEQRAAKSNPTPAKLASWLQQVEVVQWLLERGVIPDQETLLSVPDRGFCGTAQSTWQALALTRDGATEALVDRMCTTFEWLARASFTAALDERDSDIAMRLFELMGGERVIDVDALLDGLPERGCIWRKCVLDNSSGMMRVVELVSATSTALSREARSTGTLTFALQELNTVAALRLLDCGALLDEAALLAGDAESSLWRRIVLHTGDNKRKTDGVDSSATLVERLRAALFSAPPVCVALPALHPMLFVGDARAAATKPSSATNTSPDQHAETPTAASLPASLSLAPPFVAVVTTVTPLSFDGIPEPVLATCTLREFTNDNLPGSLGDKGPTGSTAEARSSRLRAGVLRGACELDRALALCGEEEGGAVLAQCPTGCGASAAIACAWAVLYGGWEADAALAYVEEETFEAVMEAAADDADGPASAECAAVAVGGSDSAKAPTPLPSVGPLFARIVRTLHPGLKDLADRLSVAASDTEVRSCLSAGAAVTTSRRPTLKSNADDDADETGSDLPPPPPLLVRRSTSYGGVGDDSRPTLRIGDNVLVCIAPTNTSRERPLSVAAHSALSLPPTHTRGRVLGVGSQAGFFLVEMLATPHECTAHRNGAPPSSAPLTVTKLDSGLPKRTFSSGTTLVRAWYGDSLRPWAPPPASARAIAAAIGRGGDLSITTASTSKDPEIGGVDVTAEVAAFFGQEPAAVKSGGASDGIEVVFDETKLLRRVSKRDGGDTTAKTILASKRKKVTDCSLVVSWCSSDRWLSNGFRRSFSCRPPDARYRNKSPQPTFNLSHRSPRSSPLLHNARPL